MGSTTLRLAASAGRADQRATSSPQRSHSTRRRMVRIRVTTSIRSSQCPGFTAIPPRKGSIVRPATERQRSQQSAGAGPRPTATLRARRNGSGFSTSLRGSGGLRVAHVHPPGADRRGAPPLWARLLILLLVASLTVMYSYAGCQQVRARQNARESIEAVDAIRGYVQRLEAALQQIEGQRPEGEAEQPVGYEQAGKER